MIKISDGKIGTREYTSVILLAIGMNLTDTTPTIYFKIASTAGWMVPLYAFFFMGIPFLVLLYLINKHQVGLVELLRKLTGKYIGSFICFYLFFVMLSATFINSGVYVDIVNTMFYRNIPYPLLLFTLLFISYLVAKRGFETIGRSAWIFIPSLHVILLLLIVFVWKEVEWGRLFPIGGLGFLHVLKESATHSATFGEIILFAAFFSYVRSYKNFRFASFLGLGFATIKVAVFMALYIMVYDYPEVIKMAYPHQELTRIASIGTSITHIEALFFAFWVLGTVIRFAIYLYLTTLFFAGALRLKQFEPLLMPIAGLALLLGLFPENVFVDMKNKDLLLQSNSIVLMLLPFLLWIIDRIKERAKNESA